MGDRAPRREIVSDARRDFAAKAAAPYLHPRLATTEISDDDEYPEHYSMDLTKLTDEELIAFERMLIKAHRRVLPPPIDLDVEDKSAGTAA